MPLSVLENLPHELKCQILLNVSDLHTLNAIVHASPSHHQVYVAQRDTILLTVLHRELEPRILAGAVATLRALYLTAREGRTTEVKDFLAEYQTTDHGGGVS